MPLPQSVEEALELAVSVSHDGHAPPAAVTRAVAELVAQAGALSAEQQRDTLERLLLGPAVEVGLDWLQRCGLLAVLLPEMEATVGFTQETGRRHKDVWKHTRRVVAQAPATPALRWAALLHDVAKVSTRRLLPSGKVTFHGHAEVGARVVDKISKRLGFSESLRKKVRALVLYHLRAAQYETDWTDGAVRRFALQAGAHLEELLLLSRADLTSARPEKIAAAHRRLDELAGRIEALRAIDARRAPLPRGLGDVLMSTFALAPGAGVGKLKRALLDAIERGELQAEQSADYYVNHLLERPALLEEVGVPYASGGRETA